MDETFNVWEISSFGLIVDTVQIVSPLLVRNKDSWRICEWVSKGEFKFSWMRTNPNKPKGLF